MSDNNIFELRPDKEKIEILERLAGLGERYIVVTFLPKAKNNERVARELIEGPAHLVHEYVKRKLLGLRIESLKLNLPDGSRMGMRAEDAMRSEVQPENCRILS